MWQEAVALDPGDDPALRSFHDEGVRSLIDVQPGPPGHRDRDRSVGRRSDGSAVEHAHLGFVVVVASQAGRPG